MHTIVYMYSREIIEQKSERFTTHMSVQYSAEFGHMQIYLSVHHDVFRLAVRSTR